MRCGVLVYVLEDGDTLKELIKQNNFNMDTNGLHIATYNCKNVTTDGDTFKFIKGLFKESQFVLLQELWLYESEFHNLLKPDNY